MKKGPLALFLAAILLGGLGYWLSAGRRIVDREAELPSDLASQPVPPAAASPAPATSTQIKTATEALPTLVDPAVQAFAQQSETVLKSLPTTEQVKALPPAETHMTPAILLQAAAKIGEQSAAVEKNPALSQEGMKFFSQCTQRGDAEGSLRALCLTNLRKLGDRAKLPVDEAGVPADVRKMADRLKGLL